MTRGQAVIHIGGMGCASCAVVIEEALNRVNGVHQASVDLATDKATVEYDPTKANMKELEKAIVDSGYTVVAG